MNRIGSKTMAAICLLILLNLIGRADSRSSESAFALSADTHSEFSTSFQVPSAGQIVVEAIWNAPQQSSQQSPQGAYRLRIVLIRPDGSEAANREGSSPLRLEYAISQTEADGFNAKLPAKWKAKVINSASPIRSEVSGKIRFSVPLSERQLEDAPFTLLGSGNAQELPVRVPVPGRLIVEVEWQTDPPGADQAPSLTISLVHPGLDRIYARRTGKSLLRIEQQITEQDLERGRRIIVRIQNDNAARVKGRVKVLFLPSL